MCNSTDGSLAGEAPHIQHLKLSLFITKNLSLKFILRLVICSDSVSIFVAMLGVAVLASSTVVE